MDTYRPRVAPVGYSLPIGYLPNNYAGANYGSGANYGTNYGSNYGANYAGNSYSGNSYAGNNYQADGNYANQAGVPANNQATPVTTRQNAAADKACELVDGSFSLMKDGFPCTPEQSTQKRSLGSASYGGPQDGAYQAVLNQLANGYKVDPLNYGPYGRK